MQLTFEATRKRCSRHLCESGFILSTLCCLIAWNCFQTWLFCFNSFALVTIVKLIAGLTIVHENSRSYLMNSPIFRKICILKGRCTNVAAFIQCNKQKWWQILTFVPPAWHRLLFIYLCCGQAGKKGLRKDTLCDIRTRDCHSCLASGKVYVCVCVSFACVKTSTGYVPVTTQRWTPRRATAST